MEILKLVLVAAHFLGMAAIVGSFFVQMRRKSDFVLGPLLGGAITQVVTGLALVGLAEATGDDLIYANIAVKLTIAVVVLVAAILAVVTQRKGGRVQPWFHTAGGLAVINVLVAVFWG
jgi:Ca2+/Na+ antiporter